MRIDRILNNNVVIIKDENGEEQVVCGKGIAYKKKAGDLLSEKLINKSVCFEGHCSETAFSGDYL